MKQRESAWYRRTPSRWRRQACLALALAVSTTTGAGAVTMPWPALVDPASGQHHVGKVIWADLVTPDLAAARRFYGDLFGWSFRDVTPAGYAVAYTGSHPVAGIVQRAMPHGAPKQPAWLTFLAVRDVAVAKRAVLKGGGTLLAETRNYPNRGTQAVFADPQGAVFAVLASTSGDPPDVLVQPGQWIWSSLLARAADADAAFYQSVFGYDVYATPGAAGAEHLVLASDDFARASANTFPADGGLHHAHWLNFIRVASVAATAAKAAALGGRVQVEPHVDRHGELIAVLEDPAGARFGVMEWSPGGSVEHAK